MNSCLKLYSNKYACDKFIEYANILRNEGFSASQIWQSEEEYSHIGINFSNDERGEFLFLEKINEYEITLEIENKYTTDTDYLIEIYQLIKSREGK